MIDIDPAKARQYEIGNELKRQNPPSRKISLVCTGRKQKQNNKKDIFISENLQLSSRDQ